MWSLLPTDYRFIEAGSGYIYFDSLIDKNSFEIAVIASYARAPLCGSRLKLYRFKKPVVFFGKARISEQYVYFERISTINTRLKNYLYLNYNKSRNPRRSSKIITDEYIEKIVFSFQQAHPNVSSKGYLCPGTLGRFDQSWPPSIAANYLVRLVSMLSVPNYDSTMEEYGCKSYRKLRKYLEPELESCLKQKCRRFYKR